jgi:hypothetical protein
VTRWKARVRFTASASGCAGRMTFRSHWVTEAVTLARGPPVQVSVAYYCVKEGWSALYVCHRSPPRRMTFEQLGPF